MKTRRLTVFLLVLVMLTVLIESTDAAFGAVWPSILALGLVFLTRNVLMGLLGGALAGSYLLVDGRVWDVPLQLVENHLLPSFSSPWKSGAIIFTLLLGGFVHLLERGGVLQSFLVRLLHGQSQRRMEAGAGAFGLICFFDGLANSLMVGRIFQPLAASGGLSKVRLAYIVDTTSAGVACLAFISTWIAYQLAMIREGFLLAGEEALAEPYQLFFASLPHNYYAWFSLILLAFVIRRQWNIGPMRQFEIESVQTEAGPAHDQVVGAGLWRAWIPVVVLLAVIFTGIYLDGNIRAGETVLPVSWNKLALSFAEANVPAILIIGSSVGAFLAWWFLPPESLKEDETAGEVFIEGMIQLFQPVLILVMAWMLSSTLGELEAADYLGQLLGGRIPFSLFPATVFLTGAVIAFTTGTSWGTMGLLMPLAIPLGFSIAAGDPAEAMRLMPMVVGAVFSGAVFGDHCSPISDTTIVSSIACGVDPMDHVRTQLPYALLAALGAALFGFLAVGIFGGAAWLSPLMALVFLTFLILLESIYQRKPSKA